MNDHARLLGVDLGAKRIGLALGDPGDGSVRSLATVRRRTTTDDAGVLRRLMSEHGATELVVGLPLLADGQIGRASCRERVCQYV